MESSSELEVGRFGHEVFAPRRSEQDLAFARLAGFDAVVSRHSAFQKLLRKETVGFREYFGFVRGGDHLVVCKQPIR